MNFGLEPEKPITKRGKSMKKTTCSKCEKEIIVGLIKPNNKCYDCMMEDNMVRRTKRKKLVKEMKYK